MDDVIFLISILYRLNCDTVKEDYYPQIEFFVQSLS